METSTWRTVLILSIVSCSRAAESFDVGWSAVAKKDHAGSANVWRRKAETPHRPTFTCHLHHAAAIINKRVEKTVLEHSSYHILLLHYTPASFHAARNTHTHSYPPLTPANNLLHHSNLTPPDRNHALEKGESDAVRGHRLVVVQSVASSMCKKGRAR